MGERSMAGTAVSGAPALDLVAATAEATRARKHTTRQGQQEKRGVVRDHHIR